MNKIIILLLLTVFIAGCGSPSEITSENDIVSTEQTPNQEIVDITKLASYAKFEASVICDQLNNEDVTNAEARAEKIARQYGFSGLAEAQAFGESVADKTDLKTQIALEAEMKCPEEMKLLNNLDINE